MVTLQRLKQPVFNKHCLWWCMKVLSYGKGRGGLVLENFIIIIDYIKFQFQCPSNEDRPHKKNQFF